MKEFLGHKLVNSPMLNYKNDLVCIICNVRLEHFPTTIESYSLITNFNEAKFNAGDIGENNYSLSCEEQQIKNLLE